MIDPKRLESMRISLVAPAERRWFQACAEWVRNPAQSDPRTRLAPVLDILPDRMKRIAALHLDCAERLRATPRPCEPSDCPLGPETLSTLSSAYHVPIGLAADLVFELAGTRPNGRGSPRSADGWISGGPRLRRPEKNRVTAVALFVGRTESSGDLIGVAADFIFDLVPDGHGDCHPVPALAFVEIAPDFQRSIVAALETLPDGLLRGSGMDIRWNLVRRDGGSLPLKLEGQSAGAAFALGLQKVFGVGDATRLDLTRTAITAALGEYQTLTCVDHFQEKLLPAMKRSVPRICTVVAAEDQDLSTPSIPERERNSRLLHDPVENLDILRAYSLTDATTRLIVNDESRWLIDCSVPDPTGFVGRRNLSAALNDFLSEPGPGYGVIAGGMGTGKTSFLAHYIRTVWRDPDSISHFIGAPPSRTTEPNQIVACLYDQLRRKHGIREPASWSGWTIAAKFEQCLRIVSRSLDPDRTPEVLFIDGADQAVVSDRDPLLPGVLPVQLPQGIRIIITSRPDLHWLKDWSSIRRFSIGNDAALNREIGGVFTDERGDIRIYLKENASPMLSGEFIEEIVQGQNAPLFFTVVTRLRQLTDPFTDPGTRRELKSDPSMWLVAPETLINTEAERIEKRATAAEIPTGKVWETLGLLALAHEPLSPQAMHDLGLFDANATNRILQLAANFFEPTFQRRLPSCPMRFAHPGYYQHVLNRLDTDALTRCRARLARACCRWDALSGAGRQYAMRHLSRHAADAGMWTRVTYSLRNLDLIEEKLRRDGEHHTTIFDVLNEYARALDGPSALPEQHPVRPQIEAVARVLDRFAQTLVEAPHLLIQQLANELLDEWDGTTLGSRLKRAARRTDRVWLRLKKRPLFPSDPTLRRTLNRHRDHVYSIAFSPKCRFLASGSGDRSAIVWDSGTGELIYRLPHDSPVTSVRFVGGSGTLAVGCLDGTLQIWNTHSRSPIHTVGFPRFAGILSMDVHPGKPILAAGCADGKIRLVSVAVGGQLGALWDLSRTAHPVPDVDPEMEGTGVLAVAFSPDGKRLASGGMDRHVRVWNLEDGTVAWKSEPQASWIETLAFSPTASILAAGLGLPEQGSGVVQLWNSIGGAYQRALYGHRSGIWALAFTPSGTQLVTGSCDRTVIVRNPFTDARIACFRGQGDSVLAVAISPDSQLISTANADRKIRIYAAPTESAAGPVSGRHRQSSTPAAIAGEPHQALIHMDRFNADGTLHCSVSEDRSARVWEVESGRLVAVLNHEESVTTATFAHRNRVVATACGHRTALWNLDRPNAPAVIIEGHCGRVLGMTFSHDDRFIATAGEDHRIMIWDARTGSWIETLSHHTGRVRCVAYSRDDRYLVSGAEDRTVVVHDCQRKRTTTVNGRHLSRIKSVAILHEQRIVASGGGSTIRLWDLDSGEPIGEFKGHTDEIWTLRFSPDGKRLASGGRDGTARVWDVRSGECIGWFPRPNNVLAVQFHGANGQELLVTDAGGSMHVPNVYHLEFANLSS